MAPFALHSLCLRDAFALPSGCVRSAFGMKVHSALPAHVGAFNARGGRIMRATWEVGNGEGDEGKLLLGVG